MAVGGGAYIINPLAIHPSVACLLAVQLPIGSREGDNARWKGNVTAMTLLALFDRLESLQMKEEVLYGGGTSAQVAVGGGAYLGSLCR